MWRCNRRVSYEFPTSYQFHILSHLRISSNCAHSPIALILTETNYIFADRFWRFVLSIYTLLMLAHWLTVIICLPPSHSLLMHSTRDQSFADQKSLTLMRLSIVLSKDASAADTAPTDRKKWYWDIRYLSGFWMNFEHICSTSGCVGKTCCLNTNALSLTRQCFVCEINALLIPSSLSEAVSAYQIVRCIV